MQILEKNATYSLYRAFTLSSEDEQILFLLYLPMVKSGAMALYQALYAQSFESDLGGGYHAHDDLLGALGLSDVQFLEARARLEAIGLMESYRKENTETEGMSKVSYLYRLLPPASPRKFFQDPLLKVNFSSCVGKKRYFSLESHFKARGEFQASDQEYVNVTTGFREIYHPEVSADDPSLESLDAQILPDKEYKSQARFSEALLREKLRDLSFDPEEVKEDWSDIIAMATLYQIDEENIAKLILDSVDFLDGKTYYHQNFLTAVRNYHQFRKEAREKKNEIYRTGKHEKLLRLFSEESPQTLLASRFNAAPSSAMLEEVEHLQKDFAFDNGIINVILDYSLRKTGNEFNRSFIDSVAYTLSANKVSTASEAMIQLSSRDYEKTRSLSTKERRRKRNEMSSTEKKEEDSTFSVEDVQKIAKELGL